MLNDIKPGDTLHLSNGAKINVSKIHNTDYGTSLVIRDTEGQHHRFWMDGRPAIMKEFVEEEELVYRPCPVNTNPLISIYGISRNAE